MFAVALMVSLAKPARAIKAQDAPAQQTPKQPTVVTTNPPDRPSPPQPRQAQGLGYFIGTWNFSWSGRESALTAGPRSGTITFTRVGDTNFLDVRAEGTVEGAGAFKESAVAAWNETGKTFVLQEKLVNNVDMLSVGDWSSPIAIRFDAQPIRAGGQLLRLRRIYNIVSERSFSVTEEISTDGGPFVRLGTGDFKKAR
jgi:hypothetical protein